jgi:hypothetical protein
MFGNAQADEAEVDVAKVVVSEGQWFETEVSGWRRDDSQICLYPRDIAHLPSSLEDP